MSGFEIRIALSVRWSATGGPGLEHCRVEANDGGVAIRAVLIGNRGGRPYGVRYRIDCDADWVVDGFAIEDVGGPGLAMRRVGRIWTGTDGAHDGRFDNAPIIDLAGTPFTNTLAIRALPAHAPGVSREFGILYVPFDTFAPVFDRQRYTCLEPFRSYRYEAVDRAFAATLPVDRFGLVTDYPGLFARLD